MPSAPSSSHAIFIQASLLPDFFSIQNTPSLPPPPPPPPHPQSRPQLHAHPRSSQTLQSSLNSNSMTRLPSRSEQMTFCLSVSDAQASFSTCERATYPPKAMATQPRCKRTLPPHAPAPAPILTPANRAPPKSLSIRAQPPP
ncbi:hypothetical protein BU17DRAFT_87097 [Hysterangium stoloniferum]|nr:hypothetical protein BU17DRAFT_87097 [Hysterangium stoloniferum]